MNDRRKQDRRTHSRIPEQPTLPELRAVFHRLWSSQVGKPEYSKRDWRELQQLMFRLFKTEV